MPKPAHPGNLRLYVKMVHSKGNAPYRAKRIAIFAEIPSGMVWSNASRIGPIPAFIPTPIKVTDKMLDLFKAKMREPLSPAPLRHNGAFQAGNAPYRAKRVAGPGLRGIDISIPDAYTRKLGFEHIEIKPNTASGLRSYDRQVKNWGVDPTTVRALTYDAQGNLRWGFDF